MSTKQLSKDPYMDELLSIVDMRKNYSKKYYGNNSNTSTKKSSNQYLDKKIYQV